jgi:hypothetical protein
LAALSNFRHAVEIPTLPSRFPAPKRPSTRCVSPKLGPVNKNLLGLHSQLCACFRIELLLLQSWQTEGRRSFIRRILTAEEFCEGPRFRVEMFSAYPGAYSRMLTTSHCSFNPAALLRKMNGLQPLRPHGSPQAPRNSGRNVLDYHRQPATTLALSPTRLGYRHLFGSDHGKHRMDPWPLTSGAEARGTDRACGGVETWLKPRPCVENVT